MPHTLTGIAAANAIPAANVSITSVYHLIVAADAADAARYYRDIGRDIKADCMHYVKVVANFKVDWDLYKELKSQDTPDILLVNNKDKEKCIIKWIPLFKDVMSRTFRSKGPIKYAICDTVAVPLDADDPLAPNSYYTAINGSLIEELIA